MKLKCKREDLLNGFQQVQNIANSRTSLPILGNVLFDAKNETITLTATDLEVGMQIKVPSRVEKEGVTTLPARKVFNLIRELSNADLEIEVEANHLASISSGSSFFKIVGFSEADFPKLPSFERKKGYTLDQKVLKDLIRKTSYAVSKDEARYVLSGLYFSFQKDAVIVVATDGRRLAHALSAGNFTETEKEMILPSKTIQEVSKILKEEGSIEIIPFESQVAFVFKDKEGQEECILISRLVEGSFPNYKQVIPEKVKERAVLNREEFFAAIRRVSVVTNEKSSMVKLAFTKNLLTLRTHTPDVGEAKEEISLAYEGADTVIAFNPAYIADVLRNLEEEEITFEFNDALNPGVIRSGKSFLYVIMPMRVV